METRKGMMPSRKEHGDKETSDTFSRELQALRQSDVELRDFIERTALVGPDGTILWANRAELELLGYTRDEYIGWDIARVHVDESVINDILACLSRGETLVDYPARLRHRDGSIRHGLISSSVLFERCCSRAASCWATSGGACDGLGYCSRNWRTAAMPACVSVA